MQKNTTKRDRIIYRLLEILPGFFSWNLIFFPYWGVFLIPEVVAYFVLIFNIYWFYQSFQIAVSATLSHFRIQATMKYNWMLDVKTFPDWKRVNQVVIIATYKEPIKTIERTIKSLANQTLPGEQITLVLAMEFREDKKEREKKVKYLREKYEDKFGHFLVTVHKLQDGEVIGKASNEYFAAKEVKRLLIDSGEIDMNYAVVTSCDADHVYHKKHFACLTFKFLDNPDRYTHFWQPAVMFYNNIWDLPAIVRVPSTLSSIWNLSQLPRKDRLINGQNYTLSFKLLHEAGYWDPDKIPEDWGIFFKAFFKKQGGIEVEPIYLPLFADAVQSETTFKTLKSHYQQQQRWAWGVSDSPWIIQNYMTVKGIPFWDKTTRLMTLLWQHFMWPVNWFIITIGITIPTIINPAFGRTTLGYTVPKISSFVLTLSMIFLIVMLFIDRVYKPKRPKYFPVWRAMLMPLEFVLMPIAGFIFGVLPGIDAHTRLMLGKYIQYKVTKKV